MLVTSVSVHLKDIVSDFSDTMCPLFPFPSFLPVNYQVVHEGRLLSRELCYDRSCLSIYLVPPNPDAR